MQNIYQRVELVITSFDVEDIITTSSLIHPVNPPIIPPTPDPDPDPEDAIHVDHGSETPDLPFVDWW